MKRILIIEDEHDMRDSLEAIFESKGYIVEAVATSESGLQSVICNKPDLIILDVMTHSLHASAFLQRIRDLPEGKNDSKVIILTNLDNEITREKVQKYGVAHFLIKSETSLEQLTQKVSALIGS